MAKLNICKVLADGVFVMWEWSWVNQWDDLCESDSSIAYLSSSSSESSNAAYLHNVTFRCIDSEKTLAYQMHQHKSVAFE